MDVQVVATLLDGTRVDVTVDAAISVNDDSILSCTPAGHCTCNGPGTGIITAVYLGLTASISLNCISVDLDVVSLDVGGDLNLVVGASADLTVLGNLAAGGTVDLTAGSLFGCGCDSILSIDANGHITAVGAGSADITVTVRGLTAVVHVNVSGGSGGGTAVGITLGGDTTVTVGGTLNLTGTLTFDDGTTAPCGDCTWTSSDETVATVSGGVVVSLSAGVTTITCTSGGISASIIVTVSPATVLSLRIDGNVNLTVGATAHLRMIATLSDGTEVDVTAAASLVCDNLLVAVIGSLSAEGWLLTGMGIGDTLCTASYGGLTVSVQVHVSLLAGG